MDEFSQHLAVLSTEEAVYCDLSTEHRHPLPLNITTPLGGKIIEHHHPPNTYRFLTYRFLLIVEVEKLRTTFKNWGYGTRKEADT